MSTPTLDDVDTDTDLDAQFQELVDNSFHEWGVVLHNDDVTPFELVAITIHLVFQKDPDTAWDLTMQVHNEGSTKIGPYGKEDATKRMAIVRQVGIQASVEKMD